MLFRVIKNWLRRRRPEPTPRVRVVLADAISIRLGQSQAVPYLPRDPLPDEPLVHTLAVGDELILEPEIGGRTERVRVDALGEMTINGRRCLTFIARPRSAHEPGATAFTIDD